MAGDVLPVAMFTCVYALNLINRRFGSLFWLIGVPIGSLFQSLGVPISFLNSAEGSNRSFQSSSAPPAVKR